MSEEFVETEGQHQDATASSAPHQPSEAPSAPANEGAYGGFDSPFSAFKSLPEFQGQDDLAIAQNLYRSFNGYQAAQQQLQQYQSVIPAASEYLRNQREFEAWQHAQAQAAQPKPEEKPKWWNPPQVKDTWKNYIVRDPSTGKEMIAPDAPYEAQQSLREYQSYTANFARKLVTDPENTLKPFIEDIANAKAKEMVEQHLNQYQASNYVQDLERQNSDWLYDQNGQVSREGQAIQSYISQASQMGIADPKARWQYATGMLQRDLLNLRHQQMATQQFAPPAPQGFAPPVPQAPPADPVAQSNMQFLRERATRTPNRSAGTTEPRAPRARMSFEDRLKGQLVNDGVI
jgi:hypothetical protein